MGAISHQLLQTGFSQPLAAIEAAFAETGHWQGELTHIGADGRTLHVVSSWAVRRGEVGERDAIIEVNTDITELKRVEASLLDNEVELRLALDASAQGVWRWELGDGSEDVELDARCRMLFGVAADACPNRETWANALAAADRAQAEAAMRRAIDPADPADDYVQEHRIQHPERGLVWVAAVGRTLFEADAAASAGRRAVRIVGTIRDISEAKRAEEERRQASALVHTIIETAPGLVYAKDLRGRMLLANAAVLEMIGKSWTQVDGRTDAGFLSDQVQADAVMQNDRRIMRQGQTEKLEEVVSGADGRPRVWFSTKAPMAGPDGEVIGLVGVSVDITEHRRAQDQLRLMLNELNHRVKNTLATVVALTAQTLRGTVPDIRRKLESRLLALASAHDVLTREQWKGAELGDVVSQALLAFDGRNPGRFRVSGPAVALRPGAVLALAMGVHELATTALKYGALSVSTGRVDILWDKTAGENPMLQLSWTERGGPVVMPPAQRGFGTQLIERRLAQDLCGTAAIDFMDPRGVVCTIEAPLDEIRAAPEPQAYPRVDATV